MTLFQRLLDGFYWIECSQTGMFVSARRKVPKRRYIGKAAEIVWNGRKCSDGEIVNDVAVLFELSMNAHERIVPNAERFARKRVTEKTGLHDGRRRFPSCKPRKFLFD